MRCSKVNEDRRLAVLPSEFSEASALPDDA